MSTLSVLLLVNDSELEDAGGSIGVGCVLSRPGKGRDAAVDACGDAGRTEGPEVCRRKRKSIY
jgi:hypothetical protein